MIVPGQSAPAAGSATPSPLLPRVPDHDLLHVIGRGAYGEVWLARHTRLGTLRAIKIIRRDQFGDARPFNREFDGIQKYEPISRSHPNLVSILHVGGADDCFYYVMELADEVPNPNDECRNPKELRNPNTEPAAQDANLRTSGFELASSFDIRHSSLYAPHTLRSELKQQGALPIDRVLEIAHALASALAHLHAHKLVHRDVKPSNVIFVGGVAKLADIGLVAGVDDARSFVGTEGYIPPEGPGTPSADCYSLGKLLYELSTGHDRTAWPEPPADLATRPDRERLLELNAILHRACAPDPRQRYANGEAMLAELELLQRGQSVRRKRALARRLALGTKILVGSLVLGSIVLGGYSLRVARNSASSRHLRAENPEVASLCKLGRFHYYTLTEQGYAKAMECFNKALEMDPNSVEAYAGIADLCNVAQPSRLLPPKAAEEKMKWVREKLMAIDSGLAEGHAVQGFISLVFDWKPEEAEKELKQALALEPELVIAHIFQGRCFLYTKRFDEAEREFKIARRLDPTRYGLNVHVGLPSFFDHRYDRAIELFTEAVEMMPNSGWALKMISRTHEEKGDYAGAIEASQSAELAWGGKPDVVNPKHDALRDAYKKSGQDGYWRKRLEFVERDYEGWGVSFQALEVAAVYAHLKDKENAFKWLDKAFEEKTEDLFWLNVDPCWDNIRSDPRFVEYLKRIGLAK